MAPQRLGSLLLGAFSLVALVLVAVGLYGVVAAATAARRTEIGVRMALGATAAEVARRVLGRGLLPVAAGLVLGLVLAIWTSRFARSFLFATEALELTPFLACGAALLGLGALAILRPALRAGRTDVAETLRDG